MLGGPGIIVQVDESKFNFNIKSHRGRVPSEKVWVFGLVETSFTPARGAMKFVASRDQRTLLSIINTTVIAGSIIFSDEWAFIEPFLKHTYMKRYVISIILFLR
jgi:hypothetical protein